MDIFKIFGIVGLVLISIGVLTRKKNEDLFYIFGGIFLLMYSFYIKDKIFIILQIIFIVSATYHFVKLKVKK